MEHRYTRSEVERMIGVTRQQLEYWTRLRLVLPRARWGERFFSFADLVALETIKRLEAHKIPARRIRQAMGALHAGVASSRNPLSELYISTNGRQVVVRGPAPANQPIEPLTGQFVLNFESVELASKVHTLTARSAEEWFEMGMEYDTDSESLEQAEDAYRRAVEAAPEWAEAHINLGATLYQLNRMEEAREEFEAAIFCDPLHALAEFNLGCVLDHLGYADEALLHLLRAVELSPSLADAHLNLALSYERREQIELSVEHLTLYLRYEPNGPWAEFARARLARYRSSHRPTPPAGKLTTFRRIQ